VRDILSSNHNMDIAVEIGTGFLAFWVLFVGLEKSKANIHHPFFPSLEIEREVE
jgi:hypothetical protein